VASIYDLKPAFQALWRPLVRRLAAAGVTANQVTVLAALASIAVGAWLASRPAERRRSWLCPSCCSSAWRSTPSTACWRASIASSRASVRSSTKWGMSCRMRPCTCRLRSCWISRGLVVAIVVLAVISELTGVVGLQVGASRRYDGPMGKSDRAFVFGALALLLVAGVPPGQWLHIVLGVVAALLVVTIVNRARRALAQGAQ